MTALETLEEITGSDDTDDYSNTGVEVYVDPNVKYQGKRCGGIKLRSSASEELSF